MRTPAVKIQIGKQGLTEGTYTTIENAFKSHKQVRVHFLKSSEDRKEIDEIASKIEKRFESQYKLSFRALGFTLIITKLKDKKP